MKRIVVWILFICMFGSNIALASDAPGWLKVNDGAQSTIKIEVPIYYSSNSGAGTIGRGELDSAIAIEASILSQHAYEKTRDIAYLRANGYANFTAFKDGSVNFSVPSDYATTTGFVCTRTESVDGKERKIVFVCFSGSTTDSDRDDPDNPALGILDDLIKFTDKNDWGLNLYGAQTDPNGAHLGFATNALGFRLLESDIWFDSLGGVSLTDIINEIKSGNEGYRIIVTGHSLGGATASLYTQQLINNAKLPEASITAYTFGSPQTNDDGANRDYPIFNFVNSQDIVTHVDEIKEVAQNFTDLLTGKIEEFGLGNTSLYQSLDEISIGGVDIRVGQDIALDFTTDDSANHGIEGYIEAVASMYSEIEFYVVNAVPLIVAEGDSVTLHATTSGNVKRVEFYNELGEIIGNCEGFDRLENKQKEWNFEWKASGSVDSVVTVRAYNESTYEETSLPITIEVKNANIAELLLQNKVYITWYSDHFIALEFIDEHSVKLLAAFRRSIESEICDYFIEGDMLTILLPYEPEEIVFVCEDSKLFSLGTDVVCIPVGNYMDIMPIEENIPWVDYVTIKDNELKFDYTMYDTYVIPLQQGVISTQIVTTMGTASVSLSFLGRQYEGTILEQHENNLVWEIRGVLADQLVVNEPTVITVRAESKNPILNYELECYASIHPIPEVEEITLNYTTIYQDSEITGNRYFTVFLVELTNNTEKRVTGVEIDFKVKDRFGDYSIFTTDKFTSFMTEYSTRYIFYMGEKKSYIDPGETVYVYGGAPVGGQKPLEDCRDIEAIEIKRIAY